MTRLPGARVLITGGSSGIGLATAHAFAAAGARVSVVAQDQDRLDQAGRAVGATTLRADLADPRQVRAVGDRLALEPPDVLVLAAGLGLAAPADALDADAARRLLEVNLLSSMTLTSAALPAMRRRDGGHVVFVGSIAGALGVAGESTYAATKAALGTYAASVDAECRRHGIRVTTVLPGVVATPFFERRGTPYDRRFPRPVPPELVAVRLVRAVERNQREAVVPRWLRAPMALRALAPGTYARLAAHLG